MNFKRLMRTGLVMTITAGALMGCTQGNEAAGTTDSGLNQDQTDSLTSDGVIVGQPDAADQIENPTTENQKANAAEGDVYLLNFKANTDDVWQELADIYEDETGIGVNIETVEDGNYTEELQSEMAKDGAPTIFNIKNAADAQKWQEYTYDLRDSELYSHLTGEEFALQHDGKVAGVANSYEAYGLIYNRVILESYGKLPNAVVSSAEEITSLDILEQTTDDIEKRVDEINEQLKADGLEYEINGAFASSGLGEQSAKRFSGQLVNLPLYYEFKEDGVENLMEGEEALDGTYLPNFKRVWDMYVRNSNLDPKDIREDSHNAEEEFGKGEAVFYQGGNWNYAPLTNEDNGYLVSADDIGIMPLYFGVDDENQGLCVGTENYWAVNAKADPNDIAASLNFLNWVITSDVGRDAIANRMGLTAPFDTFTEEYQTNNIFTQTTGQMTSDGKEMIPWVFTATPNGDEWRADFTEALASYTDETGTWEEVEAAFTDGWTTQWKLAHGQ